MTWSTFCVYFSANKRFVSKAFADKIRREAVARFKQRVELGYADSMLDFSDLIVQMEKMVAGG
jgi:hypothetical protein